MSAEKLAKYFHVSKRTVFMWKDIDINLWVVYDAFNNIKSLYKKKKWLYSYNTAGTFQNEPLEHILDRVWEGYIQHCEDIENTKEETHEPSHIDWKLDQGFRS